MIKEGSFRFILSNKRSRKKWEQDQMKRPHGEGHYFVKDGKETPARLMKSGASHLSGQHSHF